MIACQTAAATLVISLAQMKIGDPSERVDHLGYPFLWLADAIAALPANQTARLLRHRVSRQVEQDVIRAGVELLMGIGWTEHEAARFLAAWSGRDEARIINWRDTVQAGKRKRYRAQAFDAYTLMLEGAQAIDRNDGFAVTDYVRRQLVNFGMATSYTQEK
jgi:hypothetical protein